MKRLLAATMMVTVMGLSACTGQQNERVQILTDYGVTVDDGITTAELQTAMAKMLSHEGSVTALKDKFRYTFEDQPDVLQSLAGEFDRYHKIESDPVLKMQEAKRLNKISVDNDLTEFWLDQLALDGNPEAHYMLSALGGLHPDVLPRNLIFAAEHGIVDAQVDLGDWYVKRNKGDDMKEAYYWYLKAQSQGRDLPIRIAKIPHRLPANEMREVEGRIK
ncbi:hypothetical protein [Terasakiella sp.]|uniref:hypothetical protein n=1 Tax=Terasakiella sp. TaxID=2034861 RepID=UPI003AA8CD06